MQKKDKFKISRSLFPLYFSRHGSINSPALAILEGKWSVFNICWNVPEYYVSDLIFFFNLHSRQQETKLNIGHFICQRNALINCSLMTLGSFVSAFSYVSVCPWTDRTWPAGERGRPVCARPAVQPWGLWFVVAGWGSASWTLPLRSFCGDTDANSVLAILCFITIKHMTDDRSLPGLCDAQIAM